MNDLLNDLLNELRDTSYDSGYYSAKRTLSDKIDPQEAFGHDYLVAIIARTAAFNELERRLAAAERLADACNDLLLAVDDMMEWTSDETLPVSALNIDRIELARAVLAEWRAANGGEHAE